MAKYKVGDKVRVRSDLKQHVKYFMENDKRISDCVVNCMMEFLGKIVTIKYVGIKYRIEESDYSWTDEMFEGLAEQEFHEFDTVKHEKYGIGTVIEIKDDRFVKVDFDEWNENFLHKDNNETICSVKNLTLIKAYLPK